jgi:hypothetical protein
LLSACILPAQDSGGDSLSGDSPSPSGGACTSTCDCGEGELCYAGTCAEAGPDLQIYADNLARVRAALRADGSFSTESAYPTEALITLASGAALLCDADLADAARRRANFARSWETPDHLLAWSGFPFLTRDYQARHIYNLWAAGRALGDEELLTAADQAAEAMLSLERIPYGEHLLFCVTYDKTAPHRCRDHYTWVDANQNAEIGLAYALLSADPESSLYRDPLAMEVSDQELLASLTVQDEATGAIAIGSDYGYEDDYDQLYGSYTAWSWTMAQPVAAMPELLPAQAAAAAWLAPFSTGAPSTFRTYPRLYAGTASLSECGMRLPLLWSQGLLDPAFRDFYWQELVAGSSEEGTTWQPLWLMLEQGMPLAELLPPAP